MATPSARRQQIEKALAQLECFRADPAYANKGYALDANSTFLRAARSLPSYLWWLFSVAPSLDGSRLLELTDFPVEEWDIAMHERLIALQKRKRPGLIAPLVGAITEYLQKESRDVVMANLGAGGMEVDRQVARWALQTGYPYALTIVAVDKSPITRRLAEKNLKELTGSVEVVETGDLTQAGLEKLRKDAKKKVLIVMCTNDIFALEQKFQPRYFDLVYHSLFRHHLSLPEREKLDETVAALAKGHLEFDGYKSIPHAVIQSLFAWSSPVFLNGTIISLLRYQMKSQVTANREAETVLYYGNTAHYLLQRF